RGLCAASAQPAANISTQNVNVIFSFIEVDSLQSSTGVSSEPLDGLHVDEAATDVGIGAIEVDRAITRKGSVGRSNVRRRPIGQVDHAQGQGSSRQQTLLVFEAITKVGINR